MAMARFAALPDSFAVRSILPVGRPGRLAALFIHSIVCSFVGSFVSGFRLLLLI